jgi:hypothetical protein
MQPYIQSVSTINLRSCTGVRELSEPIPFTCTACDRRLKLGKTSPAVAKISYDAGGERVDAVLCAKCLDVLADSIREGPKVVEQAHSWRLQSSVVRVSYSQELLFCFKCMKKLDSHLFMKYEDLLSMKRGTKKAYTELRVCAACACAYLEMLRIHKVTKGRENKFLQVEALGA